MRDNGKRLVPRLLEGDRGALARAISLVESGSGGADELLDELYPKVGRAYRLGVTGPPGAGKSTLVGRLAGALLERGERVGVIAVDPSSPFTRGALLGDRIRFQDLPDDPRLFVRSMASRGSPGGLAHKTGEACDLLDAFGMQTILVETVGVGQSELDVAAAVHTTIVVLVPESGDEVQAMKAGLMEIGHLFVVNKADREGAERIARNLDDMIRLRPPRDDWKPPVIPVSALTGEHLDDLLDGIDSHLAHLRKRGDLALLKRERAERRVYELVEEALENRFWGRKEVRSLFQEGLRLIEEGRSSPYREAARLLRAAPREDPGR